MQTFPASVHTPWVKPGSSISSSLERFRSEAGDHAAECVKRLLERHNQCHPRPKFRDPISVVWEDSWSSTSLGNRDNQFVGTRDREGESIINMLGKELKGRNLKFTDPTFPPNVESLFVFPSAASKHAKLSGGGRIDTDAFLAGLDPTTNIKWCRPAEIFKGHKIEV